MLNFSPDAALLSDFQHHYVNACRRRTGNVFWQIPARHKSQLPQICETIRDVSATAEDFVCAQFSELSADFCLRIFKVPYPPLPLFNGIGARKRYRTWAMTQLIADTAPEYFGYCHLEKALSRHANTDWSLMSSTKFVFNMRSGKFKMVDFALAEKLGVVSKLIIDEIKTEILKTEFDLKAYQKACSLIAEVEGHGRTKS